MVSTPSLLPDTSTNIAQAPKKAISYAQAGTSGRTTRQRTELNLGGSGTDWDLHFASDQNLTNAITFTRNVDEAGFPGTAVNTLSMFGIDGNVRFRNSRILTVQRPDRQGIVRDLQISVGASVEIARNDFDVVRHESVDNDWITLVKMKAGRQFLVQNLPTVPINPLRPLLLRNDMLRLWRQRQQVRSMPYLAIVVRNHTSYVPWGFVRERQIFGPIVRATAPDGSTQPLPVPSAATPQTLLPFNTTTTAVEEEPLIDLFSDDDPMPGPSTQKDDAGREGEIRPTLSTPATQGPDVQSHVDIPSEDDDENVTADIPGEGHAERMAIDPFKSIWDSAKAGKGKGKETEGSG